jgi:hypothetical protein
MQHAIKLQSLIKRLCCAGSSMLCVCCRCEDVGFPVEQVSWQQGVAEELPLQDSSQDVVISTLVSPLLSSSPLLCNCRSALQYRTFF